MGTRINVCPLAERARDRLTLTLLRVVDFWRRGEVLFWYTNGAQNIPPPPPIFGSKVGIPFMREDLLFHHRLGIIPAPTQQQLSVRFCATINRLSTRQFLYSEMSLIDRRHEGKKKSLDHQMLEGGNDSLKLIQN
jgi:hypothetical protein